MFGLDPKSIADRAGPSGQTVRVPTLGESIRRGMIGFALVSFGGFAPWVMAGHWFYQYLGEAGLYAACAIAFMGLSGLCLHRLIIGPGSLVRCYQIFSLAFIAYAVVWTIGWMTLRGITGGIVGAFVGMVAMGMIFAFGFEARHMTITIVIALFVGNVAGYFVGEQAHNAVLALKEENTLGIVLEKPTRILLSKTAWGLCYGLGFGAGIGFTFHTCQAKARKIIAEQP